MSASEKMIVNAVTFDARSVRFNKPKLNKSGGKHIGVNGPSGEPLHLSTPLMLTWGVNEFTDDTSGRRTYDLSLQFPSPEYQTPETDAFLKNMLTFQDWVQQQAVTMSKEWFCKKAMSREVVDALCHPMLRYPRDPNTQEPDMTRAPCLRVKLDYWDEAFNCEIYDIGTVDGEHKRLFPKVQAADGQAAGPMELIPKGTQIATVIRCGGLWFANGKFGCTWRLVQAVVKPRASLKGRCVIQLSTADTATLQKQEDPEAGTEQAASSTVGVEVEESEDEEDGESGPSFAAAALIKHTQEEAAPAPAPAKKKRVVRRKAKAAE
jgi:hypothetical protein